METDKKYTGPKLSRIKAMLVAGIISTNLLAPGMAQEANAAGRIQMSEIHMTDQQRAAHDKYMRDNFTTETIRVKDPSTYSRRAEALGIKQKTVEVKVFRPTPQKMQEIDELMQEIEQTQLQQRVNRLEQQQNSHRRFVDSLSTTNPNSQYYQPNSNNIKIGPNTRIYGNNIHIGEINER